MRSTSRPLTLPAWPSRLATWLLEGRPCHDHGQGQQISPDRIEDESE